MNKGYALLDIKSVDEEQRIVEGIASTPMPDRQGDIMEPKGAEYSLPMAFLWHHGIREPIGEIFEARPTKDGIAIKARVSRVDTPGAVHDRVEEAWHSFKAKPPLVRGLSIDWAPKEFERIPGTDFIRHTKWIWAALSAVTIPANIQASITKVKELDLAASGLHSPGVSGSLPVVRVQKDAPRMPNTIKEQITAFENTRASKSARMTELMTKAADKGETLDDAETQEYDGLALEVKSVDAHLVRLRELEKTNIVGATPITAENPQQASLQRGGTVTTPVITVKANVPKGTAFVRFAMAKAWAKGDTYKELEYAKQWESSTPEVALMLKAASAAGSTTDATWAGPLAVAQPSTTEFLELLRPATLVGKIPGLRQIPFNTSVPTQTAGGTYTWVGQGAPKPVGTLAFTTTTLPILKASGIIVITEELARVSTPSAEMVVRNDLVAGSQQYLDTQFIDPTVAASANVSPGSVTNGTSAITSSGTSADNARTDLKALVANFATNNVPLANAVFVMSESNGFAIASAVNALGQPLFPGMTAKGGNIFGVPVVTSNAAGTTVALINASDILYADEGGVNIDISREASVQMDSAPDNPPTASTVIVSLWQANLIGLRVDRFINWKRARTVAVKYTSQTYV